MRCPPFHNNEKKEEKKGAILSPPLPFERIFKTKNTFDLSNEIDAVL